ncbi:hypothetical protein BT96DRAFT_1004540 [Gymnopus androsaceus JB14]|uniref:Uncharacterized protein n=1 Tax=Gymnopus androsaceus JB14 TaxID=1447944 RepID=A0A6A4GQJ6_9AGAR|nr:hypothetical protein BT96DRAFT_1004540 [Gymnopus androsaceus JB14]
MACLGKQDAVDAIVTETGVKDKLAHFWIEQLISKARELTNTRITEKTTHDPRLNNKNCVGEARKATRQELLETIQEEVWGWLLQQPPDDYKKLDLSDHMSLRKMLRPGQHFNPLLSTRGLNPSNDTTVESLHTWLLGGEKYIWHLTTKGWTAKEDELFATRLQSSSVDGLTTNPPRAWYLIKYKNSLIGKHFKIIQQLAVDLQIALDNYLDIWAQIDPTRIITKSKLHVLLYLVPDIRRFGPSILYSTEVCECWNKIFRGCSILSNHLAPSHDIAITLGDMKCFKHQVSRGYWKDNNGKWIRAGSAICDFLLTNTELQWRLGWVDNERIKPGTVKPMSLGKRNPVIWEALQLPSSYTHMDAPAETSDHDHEWFQCKHVISHSHEPCITGSWVFFKDSDTNITKCGRISSIVGCSKSSAASAIVRAAFVVVEDFVVLKEKDDFFDMPVMLDSKHCSFVIPKV